jgi:hypothetical protein
MRFAHFKKSFQGLFERSPAEKISPSSRYAIVGDLRMGDGGKHDSLRRHGDLVERVLGTVYLPEGYSLVLAGDTEDLRNYWSKDIEATWRRLYGLFDEFALQGSLQKLIGERELGLIRKQRSRYRILHGLRLDWKGFELFVLHGHQAARYFAAEDYEDFLQKYQHQPRRIRDENDMDDPGRLYRTERRLYRASLGMGIATIFGHTGRALFESQTEYDELRSSIEGLFRKDTQAEARDGDRLDAMIKRYRQGLMKMDQQGRGAELTLKASEAGPLVPCLFNPGLANCHSGLDCIEIHGTLIRKVRWVDEDRARPSLKSRALGSDRFEESGLVRYILGESDIESVRDRIRLLSPGRSSDGALQLTDP